MACVMTCSSTALGAWDVANACDGVSKVLAGVPTGGIAGGAPDGLLVHRAPSGLVAGGTGV